MFCLIMRKFELFDGKHEVLTTIVMQRCHGSQNRGCHSPRIRSSMGNQCIRCAVVDFVANLEIFLSYYVTGHFYLTKLLLPILISTAKKSPDGKARVVNTSSSGHVTCKKLNFNTFKDGPARKKERSFPDLYGQSKLVRSLYLSLVARLPCNLMMFLLFKIFGFRETSCFQMN
jgi:hypothetical protein